MFPTFRVRNTSCLCASLERAPKSEEPHAVPLPVALPFFASGIGALGLLARRGKRKAAA